MDAARLLLGAAVAGVGVDTLLHPLPRTERTRPLIERLAPVPALRRDPEPLVRVHAAVIVAAGLLLATGRAPRLTAVTLAGAAVPGICLDHPFWAETDPAGRRAERARFLLRLGPVAAALIAARRPRGAVG